MKSLRYIISGILVTGVLNAYAQSSIDNKLVIDKVIAKVDDYAVFKSDIEKLYLDLLSRGQVSGPEAKCEILESLVTQKMLLAQAEIDSVVVLDAEVSMQLDQRMAYFISQFGGSEEELEEYYGKPLEQIQEEIRDDLSEQMTVERMRDEITSETSVTPSEIRRFFHKIPKDSLPYFSEEVTVGQIVMVPTVSDEQKQQTRSFLYDLKSRIENGEDFGALARKYSQDPGSASNGGEYAQFIKRGEFVPEFEAAAFAMEINEISEPVETDFGFHLIQLLDRRGNEYRVRHILIMPQVMQSDIDRTKAKLDSVRSLILVDSIPFEKLAKELSEDKLTSQNGGYFTDGSGADRLPTEQLDYGIYFALDTMKLGSISNPMIYDQPDGKKAVRLLYYKAKYRPHKANLEDDWQKISSAALNEKKSRIETEWFDKSKYDFFILVDEEYQACNILGRK